jgi:hypothetical protein
MNFFELGKPPSDSRQASRHASDCDLRAPINPDPAARQSPRADWLGRFVGFQFQWQN